MAKVIGVSTLVNFICDLLLSLGGRVWWLEPCGFAGLRVLQNTVPHGLPAAQPRRLHLWQRWSGNKFQRGSVPRSKSQLSQGVRMKKNN